MWEDSDDSVCAGHVEQSAAVSRLAMSAAAGREIDMCEGYSWRAAAAAYSTHVQRGRQVVSRRREGGLYSAATPLCCPVCSFGSGGCVGQQLCDELELNYYGLVVVAVADRCGSMLPYCAYCVRWTKQRCLLGNLLCIAVSIMHEVAQHLSLDAVVVVI
jgi:hypothetical protein